MHSDGKVIEELGAVRRILIGVRLRAVLIEDVSEMEEVKQVGPVGYLVAALLGGDTSAASPLVDPPDLSLADGSRSRLTFASLNP
jgi:hypothetical protein